MGYYTSLSKQHLARSLKILHLGHLTRSLNISSFHFIPGKVINNTAHNNSLAWCKTAYHVFTTQEHEYFSSLPDGQPYTFSPLLYWSSMHFISSNMSCVRGFGLGHTKLLAGYCDKSHFYLLSSSFFPYIFNTITTKRWQVANKETLLWHSWAFRPSWLAWSLWPFWLTQHYQDYDDNHDDRAGFLLAIQYASLYSVAFCGQPY